MTQEYEDFKQTLAHEAFHCIQSSRYWDQTKAGGNVPYKDWWLEGTAEYFSNTVYPDVNREWRHSGMYNPDTSLLAQSYEVNFFFQDLANQAGNDTVLRLMASLPTAAGADQQQNALAAFAGIQEFLHSFGRHYLEQSVHDSGVLLVAVEPVKGELVNIDGTTTLSFGVPAFTLQRRQLEFAPGQSYRIVVDEGGGSGRLSAHEVAAGASWSRLPDELTTECENPRSYELLATSALAQGATEYNVEINVDAEPRTDCDKQMLTCTQSAEHDSCVIGTWIADQEFMTEQLRTLLRGRAAVAPVSGEERVAYLANGAASGTVGTTFQSTAHLNTGDTSITVATDSQQTSAWSTDNGMLYTCFASGDSSVSKEVIFPRGRESGTLRPGTARGVVFPYVCSGNTLELTLPGGVMKKRYNRTRE
ncbi:MAG: hypothetical protein KDI09_18645 [Halioglobus sp.]|nr:hypothetical protein [Halioglobus sp.]